MDKTGKLLVTVTAYGGTLEDAATALSRHQGTFDLLNGGEVEITAVEVADG